MPQVAVPDQPLLREVAAAYAALSPQLKVIARYVERHHDSLAQQRIQDVAARCQVQPSAVVRFAQRFGLRGYQELKQALNPGWAALAAASTTTATRAEGPAPRAAAAAWPTSARACAPLPTAPMPSAAAPVDGCAQAVQATLAEAAAHLRRLQEDLHLSVLQATALRLVQARRLWIVGAQRAFPVAAYLADVLQGPHTPVQWINLLGGPPTQLSGATADDVLLVIHLGPNCQAVVELTRMAQARGLALVVVCDHPHPSLVQHATHTLWLDPPGPGLSGVMAAADALRTAWDWARTTVPAPAGPAAACRPPPADVCAPRQA